MIQLKRLRGVVMVDRIIKDVCIKCNKCGRDIKFKVYYNKDREKENIYLKSNLDDVEVCSCNGAYKQYSTAYENMDNEIDN